jgi:hypothetical protein
MRPIGRIDLERGVSWVGPGPARTAAQTSADELRTSLGELGFAVRELEGERIVSLESFFAEAQ